MREVRKTIIVATLAAMLLKLEAEIPLDHGKAWLACIAATTAGVAAKARA